MTDTIQPIKVVLMCGSRTYDRPERVRAALRKLLSATGTARLLIITGGAPGADTLAEEEAKAMGVHVARVDALWGVYGKRAGPFRNGMMLALQPNLVVAFHPNIDESSGTKNCLKQAAKLNIKRRVIR